MNMNRVVLRHIALSLKHPFQTHQSKISERHLIIVEAIDSRGRKGFGEVTAFSSPFYTSETVKTAWHILKDILIPQISWEAVDHPSQFHAHSDFVQGNPMAKAGLEGALWDLYAKQQQQSLSEMISGSRTFVKAGAVLSLSDSIEADINRLKEEGYERFKLKVQKGMEKEAIDAAREIDPLLTLMIDGNGQYRESDMAHLISLEEDRLLMIEQPFRSGDFHLHRMLQKQIDTPVCLDESVMCFQDAVQAIQLESCKMINVKISRVGGMAEAIRIHDYCQEHEIPVWCGGMIESGISKAHNLALSSLNNFTVPGDLSSSLRYFKQDLLVEDLQVKEGSIKVPEGPGIGVEVNEKYLEDVTLEKQDFLILC